MVYEYPYNYSNGTSVDGIGSFFQYVSYIEGYWLAPAFLLVIWIFVFGLSLAIGTRKAMSVASFVSFVLSIYLFNMGTLNILFPITFLILTIIGLIGGAKDSYL